MTCCRILLDSEVEGKEQFFLRQGDVILIGKKGFERISDSKRTYDFLFLGMLLLLMADIILSRGAEITFEAFSMNDKKRLEKALLFLRACPFNELLRSKKLKQIAGSVDVKLYLMRATPDIRFVLEFEDEPPRVKIVDIVRHDRLEKIYAHESELQMS